MSGDLRNLAYNKNTKLSGARKMAREGQGESSRVDIHPGGGEYQPVRDPRDPDDEQPDTEADLGLIMFKALTIITATAALLCMDVNLVSLLRSFRWKVDIFVGILRLYGFVFALFTAVAETEWEWLFRNWPYLQYWFYRGNLQIFVAVLTKALSGASREVYFERLMHDIAAWMLLGCGFIYALSGLLCMRQLKRRRKHKKEFRDQTIKDLQDLEKRKRELQGQLAAGA